MKLFFTIVLFRANPDHRERMHVPTHICERFEDLLCIRTPHPVRLCVGEGWSRTGCGVERWVPGVRSGRGPGQGFRGQGVGYQGVRVCLCVCVCVSVCACGGEKGVPCRTRVLGSGRGLLAKV